MKTKPMFHKKKYEKEEDADGFIFEDILFKNTEDGKVRCGVCQVECSRLIVHMNGNEYCTEYFSNMATFKLEYSKYRHKKSKRNQEDKNRHEPQDTSNENDGSVQDTKIRNDNSEHCQTDDEGQNEAKEICKNLELF